MSNLAESIDLAIKNEISKRIREIMEEEINTANQNIARRIRNDLAHISLSVLQHYEISMNRGEILIRVKNDVK